MEPEVLLRLRLEEAAALRRLNRFVVEARTPSGGLRLHTRNTGRLTDLIYPGSRLLYAPRSRGKTSGLIVGVSVGGEEAAIIDPATQTAAFEEAWKRGLVGWLRGWRASRREAWYQGSRIDYGI